MLCLMVFGSFTPLCAEQLPDAKASNPEKLQWMQGFPPEPERLITQPQSNFFSFPKLRWSVCHIRELMPTKQVSRGIVGPGLWQSRLAPDIDKITFNAGDSKEQLTWRQSLARNYTDGILVLHKGVIVYEQYFGCMRRDGKHAAMSMTKSLIGLLAEILIAEGTLDDRQLVKSIIPELADSGFGDATIRQVMDMTTAVDFNEDYSDPGADIWQYSVATDPFASPSDGQPVGYFAYLKGVKKQGIHGKAFGYRTVNTDVLGWVIARKTGKDVASLLSDKIWQHIDAEQDAYMTVDRLGTPFAGGGLSAGLRDLGRLGQLLLDDGKYKNKQIIPAATIASIEQGGDKAAFAKAGYLTLAGGSYRSMWWLLHNKNNAYAARGVHGQTLYIDPVAQMVIVRFASFPHAKNHYIDPTSLPAYEALADYLLKK
ncbi:serine hydrolase [Salinimonas iocasae]|uniref:Serine hydrolase n=2 Tax=Salinimonas iocasae TaxID=2572577 RepID=A0A5B7YHL4_9ALTE|nr:serine hydrolase [Salinimonas iocasae]